MHQSLCNPPKLSFLAAIPCGFLCRDPQLTTKTVIKYLPPSPAMSKGHMKQPHQGLCSTTPKIPCLTTPTSAYNCSMPNLNLHANHNYNFNGDKDLPSARANLFNEFDDHSMASIFCFGAFTNKTTNILYNDCTRDFPFISLERNVCYFVMYQYKTNTILVTAIPGLDSASILAAYTKTSNILRVRVTNQNLT
jgi:hypothetical protein